ncbi:MAG: hypothetical protein IKM66_03605 [Clostridia bacterium]|nr:hypothetical protein [Clostridia bacterium]
MKVSGSQIERVKAWTNIGYEASEQATIQSTVEKLSKEGKHVINIIHGDKTMIGGDYTKTITFLWEADDTDPVYIAAMEKAKAEEERERIVAEIKMQEKRKQKAVYVQKGMKPSIRLTFGILLIILGYLVVFGLSTVIDYIIDVSPLAIMIPGAIIVISGYALTISGIVGLVKYKIHKEVKKGIEENTKKN